MRIVSSRDAAAQCLRDGGLIAYPTEAMFGLGCMLDSQDALTRLRRIKSRAVEQAFVVVGADAEQLRPLVAQAAWDDFDQIKADWPSRTSWILPRSSEVSDQVTGGLSTIAVRVPDHAVCRALLALVAAPIVSTSANRRGASPVRSAEAAAAISDALDLIYDQPIGAHHSPSALRVAATGEYLRGGPA